MEMLNFRSLDYRALIISSEVHCLINGDRAVSKKAMGLSLCLEKINRELRSLSNCLLDHSIGRKLKSLILVEEYYWRKQAGSDWLK